MRDKSPNFEPLTPTIGALVQGVDLTQPLDDRAFAALNDGLLRHHVLFFRDQDLPPQSLIDLGRRFGDLSVHPFAPNLDGHPEIMLVENDRERLPQNDAWHTDMTYMERPNKASILLCRIGPESGGDTMWADLQAAWDALSSIMQDMLCDLAAVHDYAHIFKLSNPFGRGLSDKEMRDALAQHPPVEHPLVVTHPESGRRCLYVDESHTTHIKDMADGESRALLRFLYDHATQHRFLCRFRWRPGSLAIWDNRCTQHYAFADFWPQHRLMHRVTISAEDRPRR